MSHFVRMNPDEDDLHFVRVNPEDNFRSVKMNPESVEFSSGGLTIHVMILVAVKKEQYNL